MSWRALEKMNKCADDMPKRNKIRELKKALRIFTSSTYGGNEWMGMLHEEGCPGVRLRPNERMEHEKCHCDGDYLTTLVRKALR